MTAIRPVARGPHIESPEEAQERLRREIHAGLHANPKTLPPKLFYDDTGARLFEEITKLDEYYVTRTEREIMQAHAAEMASLIGPNAVVIEPGSGEAIKVRVLLDHLEHPAAYVPIDISAEQLARVARELTEEYEHLDVVPLEADFTRGLCLPELPEATRQARRVAFFPGSTIGNLHPPQAVALLREITRAVGPRGGLLLGVDLRKDPTILHAAYNDARRVTAAFNKNALVRLNREFGATFDVDRFRHYAYYNPVANRVEMHLVSLETHMVVVDGERFLFEQGEPIWTESSYKYSPAELEGCAREAGLVLRKMWCDRRHWFMVAFFEAKGIEGSRDQGVEGADRDLDSALDPLIPGPLDPSASLSSPSSPRATPRSAARADTLARS